MDKKPTHQDRSSWTLNDWIKAETGNGAARAEFINYMIDFESKNAEPDTLFTQAESEILYGLQFDLAQANVLSGEPEKQQALAKLIEEIVNRFRATIIAAARERRQNQQKT